MDQNKHKNTNPASLHGLYAEVKSPQFGPKVNLRAHAGKNAISIEEWRGFHQESSTWTEKDRLNPEKANEEYRKNFNSFLADKRPPKPSRFGIGSLFNQKLKEKMKYPDYLTNVLFTSCLKDPLPAPQQSPQILIDKMPPSHRGIDFVNDELRVGHVFKNDETRLRSEELMPRPSYRMYYSFELGRHTAEPVRQRKAFNDAEKKSAAIQIYIDNYVSNSFANMAPVTKTAPVTGPVAKVSLKAPFTLA